MGRSLNSIDKNHKISTQQGLNDRLGVHRFEVIVVLPRANENNRLAGGVHHGNGCSDLLVDRVELGKDDTINEPWLSSRWGVFFQSLEQKYRC